MYTRNHPAQHSAFPKPFQRQRQQQQSAPERQQQQQGSRLSGAIPLPASAATSIESSNCGHDRQTAANSRLHDLSDVDCFDW